MQSNDQQQQGQPPNYPFFSANSQTSQPAYNASPSILSTLSQDELRRHQLSSNGTDPSDPYATARIAMFPVTGARRPYGSQPNQPVPGSTYNQAWPGNPDSAQSAIPQVASNPASISLNDSSTHSSPTRRATALSGEAAGFDEFLAEMPLKGEDAARHTMFTELIRMKTRSIELQIAEARRKEREAEAELAKWKVASEQRIAQTGGESGANVTPNTFDNMGMNPFELDRASVDSTAGASTMYQQSNAPSTGQQTGPASGNGLAMNIPPPENPPTPITQFDLEAMMHDSNLEGLFSWLPDFATQQQQSQQQQQQQQQQMPPPQQPNQSLAQSSMSTLDANNFLFGNMSTPYLATNDALNTPSLSYNTITSPAKRSASPLSDNEATSPHVKRSKKSNEKKIVVERAASCPGCGKAIGRIMFRAPRAHMPDDISVDLKCPSCAAVDAPATLPDPATMGTSIGTVEMRKRMRATLETEDEEKRVFVRRQFCDVCQRVVGSGRLVAGAKENMSSIAEIVCAPCDAKYQRCTDCGGGGGPRIGIGKWRMKQVFPLGRKTCSLSHTRLGDRPREIGVHVTPSDFSPEQLKEVLTRTKGLWNEKTLARLAVPEMLEIDLPPDVINPLRDYADVEDIITRNWPTREAMIKADGADPARFKRLLGLIWAHPKSRRAVRTVDLEEEEYARTADDDEADMSTVLANVKRTNVVIPPGSELVGMWGGEWDMKHGALLITTLIPFEGADGEDSTALSVGEMITTVQGLRSKINEERKSKAAQQGKQPELVPQCEHLWVVSGGTMPLVRERVADFLIRKRSFVHVEEYLTRHPDFIHALKARPVGLHPDLHRPIRSANGEEDEIEARPLVLVRWLGKDFDAAKIREIKLQEFGGKAKLKGKKAKAKV